MSRAETDPRSRLQSMNQCGLDQPGLSQPDLSQPDLNLDRLTRLELGKLRGLPMLAIFLCLCLAFNIFLLTMGKISAARAGYSSGIEAEEVGLFGSLDYSYGDAGSDDSGGSNGSDDSGERIEDAGSAESAASAESPLENIFADYDAGELGRMYISMNQIFGAGAAIVEKKYELLQPAVDLLAEKEAALDTYAGAYTNVFHEQLFNVLMRALLTEGILMGILLALYLMGYERLQGTEGQVLATAAGRQLHRAKGLAALAAAGLSWILLALPSLMYFMALWRPWRLFSANVSSQLHTIQAGIMEIPFITWTSFSLGGYLAAALVLAFLTVLLFTAIGVVLGMAARDMFRGFLAFVTLAAVNFGLIFNMSSVSWTLCFLLNFTPGALWLWEHLWFTEMAGNSMTPWQESWTYIFCAVCLVIAYEIAKKRYNRRDVI